MKITLSKKAQDRLIFALDFSGTIDKAMAWVDLLRNRVGFFKVGKEAFTSFGPELVRLIHSRGARVFLDLKYHDIPNTAARAAEAAFDLEVGIFNLHALGGREMIKRTMSAVTNRRETSGKYGPIVLAVTVLTSLTNDDLKDIGYRLTTDDLAFDLARLAQDAGADGAVVAPKDVERIRKACGDDFVLLTPGIRETMKIAGDDQRRVLSAEEAISLGADFLVIGRPIALAPDPLAAAEGFLNSITQGLGKRP